MFIDDDGNETPLPKTFDEFRQMMALTPKGYLVALLLDAGMTYEAASEVWDRFESKCQKMLRDECPEGDYAALIFDGEGGLIAGCSLKDIE
jgi:hypothetical protein